MTLILRDKGQAKVDIHKHIIVARKFYLFDFVNKIIFLLNCEISGAAVGDLRLNFLL